MSSVRIDTALAEASRMLSASPTPRLDAELLLAHVLHKPRSYFFTWPEALLTSEQMAQLVKLIDQRKAGHPIAYLTGQREFWSLQLKVTEATLIPRPDTELLVELALGLDSTPDQNTESTMKVADLGTGTGAIALALARERPDWEVTAIDKSPDALAVAAENAVINDIRNTVFIEGSWCSPLAEGSMDMIVSNPPYICSNDPHLKQGDVRYEPLSALVSGVDGLDDIRVIAEHSLQSLKPGGWLLLEHGYDQGSPVQTILSRAGFTQIRTETDLAGHDRVTLARKPAA
ncbi:peptide chain release factor N(5)-glutamine methyltransferase [Endozoicomonas sp. GU-1]|uniref:peptide chain release factor N(5)-glutamine methyltransferase n=1 Tax=Endozoicomonas sp. GU-1 TaxID=3009078 RepID=UPI0022B355B5|nr:peptide chain release factor N(5)-glutamine methyltransferase [Endozoicomonas sp. GU-1]WBA83062.1 peptide chain release factor N(5)-glutamine methyltransferase [Endozoicomonas sp. GU-1]WBA85984.1 peptide chain release factor N(5)-glutamine methyltransferase [Endozoicomonas sp. GU-1]